MKNDNPMFYSNITETIPEEEYNGMDLMFESLDATARVTHLSLLVIDFSKNKMVYRTENMLFVDCEAEIYARVST